MSISNQELSDLKSRALTAIRTRAGIARVDAYLDELIREVGSSQPERGKETDTEYLLTVIAEVEAQRSKPQNKTSAPRHEKVVAAPKPVVVEAPPEVTVEETAQEDQWSEPVQSFVEEQEEASAPAHEDTTKSKSGKKSKAEKKK